MEQALCAYLMTKSTVTSLIGSGEGGRLYPIAIPQDWSVANGPAVAYEIVSSNEEATLADRSGFVQSRIKFICHSDTYTNAVATARAIKNCGVCTLKGISGGVDFRGVEIDEGITCYGISPSDGSSEWRYIAEIDLMVSYHEE